MPTAKSASKAKRPASDPLSQLPVRGPSRFGYYGCRPDLPDHRDLLYAAPLAQFPQGLPDTVDLRRHCPPVYNQGRLGSCTGNGIAAAIEFDQLKQHSHKFLPSRLFIYYNERVIEGDVRQDNGAQIRDGIKSVAHLGAPPESDWPYIEKKFAHKPPRSVYAAARRDLVSRYMRVHQDLMQLRGCLAEGYPIVIGITAYASFESQAVADTGVVPMPKAHEKTVGGHCMLAVGYHGNSRRFIVRNSWGATWGRKGYCTLPFEYLLDPHLSSDFWTIRSVSG